jgi:hypothetical protein
MSGSQVGPSGRELLKQYTVETHTERSSSLFLFGDTHGKLITVYPRDLVLENWGLSSLLLDKVQDVRLVD